MVKDSGKLSISVSIWTGVQGALAPVERPPLSIHLFYGFSTHTEPFSIMVYVGVGSYKRSNYKEKNHEQGKHKPKGKSESKSF